MKQKRCHITAVISLYSHVSLYERIYCISYDLLRDVGHYFHHVTCQLPAEQTGRNHVCVVDSKWQHNLFLNDFEEAQTDL